MKDIEIAQVIEAKKQEINTIRLQIESPSFHIILHKNISKKQMYNLAVDLSTKLGLEMQINRKLFGIDTIKLRGIHKKEGFWSIGVRKRSIWCTGFGVYASKLVRTEITGLMEAIKNNTNIKNIGVYGLNGLIVPEIASSGLKIVPLD